MRPGLWTRILAFIGIEEEWEGEEASASDSPPASADGRRKGALVSLPGGQSFRVVVARPSSFEEVQGMADQLKGGRPVLLNLDSTPKDTRSRIVNFLIGVIYALDGQMQRVGGGILLFAPHNVDVEYVGPVEDLREDESSVNHS